MMVKSVWVEASSSSSIDIIKIRKIAGRVYSCYTILMNHLITVTKSDGTTQLFEEEKLIQSLRKSGAVPEVVDDIVEEVENEMKDGISTAEIYRRAFELLKKHSYHIAAKYSIRRAIFDLGPDGFPFEKFVAKIFNIWGYEAITDQAVMGNCVDHEIDVVAWKDDNLAMVEAKFHNELGLKSDLKVVLYVYARYEDLKNTTFNFGGSKRKLSEGWLITNTKFTEKAVKYGECKGLKMIGWNYPQMGNLHDIISQFNLHPITSLLSLSKQQKRDLVDRNILICSDLFHNEKVLHDIGLHQDVIEKVREEAQSMARLAK